MILSFHGSPDKSQISYFLLCNYIDLFIPVAIPESDRLFNHAQSHQLAGDKGHTIWPGRAPYFSSQTLSHLPPGWIVWQSSRQMNDPSFHESPDKSQISYILLCNYIDLFIPVAIPELDRLFNHAQSLQLAGDKGHTVKSPKFGSAPKPGRIVWPQVRQICTSQTEKFSRHILILYFSSIKYWRNCRKICQTLSDRPKIIEKFSQPADENGHVILPGA